MTRAYRTNSSASGFTVLELLVVISVIGLLASVILVNLSASRDRARNANALLEVRQLQLALEIYYQAHGGYPNPALAPTMYCIGGATCVNPLDNATPITNTLSLRFGAAPVASARTASLASYAVSLIAPATAHAATYSVPELSKFSSLDIPIVYQCTTSANPCASANSWVWYTQKSGRATTWTSRAASAIVVATSTTYTYLY